MATITPMPVSGGLARAAVLHAALSLAALPLLACQPDLTECDPAVAQRPAFDAVTGMSAFEGQALVVRGCGGGAFCHADGVAGDERFGAPDGLDLNLLPAAVDGTFDPAASERLARNQFTVVRERHQLFSSIASGWMPVGGAAGDAVLSGAPAYIRVSPEDGTLGPLPEIGTDEGVEIMRNWLACGAPVVARPQVRDDGRESVGFIVPGRDVTPLEADWDDIYDRLVVARCNSTLCHGGGSDSAAGLNLVGRDEALQRLRDGVASVDGDAAACGDTGLPLLVPGDPDGSLFFTKLTSDVSCGDRMPLEGSAVDAASLENVRAWIIDLD